ncbi:unnamed protein product [Amoebophrya sp. A25]|nr:unnamed protein product [Amoebophrya sp. A25]CAD7976713.1 unnamed protein product [Amoebophrya sp. A25]|eukprot:GSA25T00027358001.1
MSNENMHHCPPPNIDLILYTFPTMYQGVDRPPSFNPIHLSDDVSSILTILFYRS